MHVALIAAIGLNREIGAGNKLLWHIKEDMNWFRQKTKNKVVVMGRKTYESIGKPLKGRVNVVLTRNKEYDPHPDVFVRHNLEDIFFEFRNELEIMVIGGETIYNQFLPYANRIYLTQVEKTYEEADAFFPEFDRSIWNRYFYQDGSEDIGIKYNFSVYKKMLKLEGEG
ncbi:dihydrofolate reductase [Bacillus phage 043JT007]|nr:dihydrofolate reductase [Bacillus phage 043JT007]